jgi:hypothetical protein
MRDALPYLIVALPLLVCVGIIAYSVFTAEDAPPEPRDERLNSRGRLW